jgi:acyl-coenzyme A thioesterase PaaI-like protein
MTARALQDLLPGNGCWGCGPDNPGGLHVKSYLEGDESVCRFQPSPHHVAGPPHVVNGGIIAAVIDCHTVVTAIADAYRLAGREVGTGPQLWAVTAKLQVEYLAPVPIDQPMELRARVRERRGRKRVIECTLRSGGRECARAEVLAVEVPAAWTTPPG